EAEAEAGEELPDWLAALEPSAEAEAEVTAPPAEAETEEAVPDWLAAIEPEAEAAAPPAEVEPEAEFLPTEEEPALPDWLKELGETLTPPEQEAEAAPPETAAAEAPPLPAEAAVLAAAAAVDQLAPAESPDAVRQAADTFHAIATQPPAPAALPAALTPQERLKPHIGRAIFALVLLLLLVVPLWPGLQKTDPTGRPMPWTEPTGPFGEELDRQRRELISSELGIVDIQPPGSVALVSIDYTPATQGEMEPLAAAVIGRLRGQGMRVVLVSLNPEGAALADSLVQKVIQERDEAYGESMVNLGYLPGEAAAVRRVVSGQERLSARQEYRTGLALGQMQNWAGVENFRQVRLTTTLADNPATARWWIEQMAAAAPPDIGERYLLAAVSAAAGPFLQPYRASGQLDGLLSGVNSAAAVEAVRRQFGPARQMLDSQSIAHLLLIIAIVAGTIAGWMPSPAPPAGQEQTEAEPEPEAESEPDSEG
ncbi:MAG: hypothetical protein D6784_17130, partial [Chloroflexi bacterium]